MSVEPQILYLYNPRQTLFIIHHSTLKKSPGALASSKAFLIVYKEGLFDVHHKADGESWFSVAVFRKLRICITEIYAVCSV